MSFSCLRVAVLVEQNDLAVMNVVQIPETDISKLRVTLRHLGADPVLGLVGKYKIAWDATVNSLLEEADFFSLAHLLGPETELESSILLAQHCY